MRRETINRISAIVPIVMSTLAFLLALAAGVAGWDKGAADEGALAHAFQLLIVAQVPFCLAFLGTANWHRLPIVARTAILQTAAGLAAFAPVAYFNL
jgi:hypothetical protein